MGGKEVDIGLLVNLRKFIKEGCNMAGLCSLECGGAVMHKHFQMMVKGNFSILPLLNKKIKVCLGWDEKPVTCHVVCCKRLRNEGFNMLLGMLGIV